MAVAPSEAQQLLARLKERSEQTHKAAAAAASGTSSLGSLSFSNKGGVNSTAVGPSILGGKSAALDLVPVQGQAADGAEEGSPDSTTILGGTKLVLRGVGGCCLSVAADDAGPSSPLGPAPTRFRGAADGHGFGDAHECLTLHNRHVRAAGGGAELPIRYGDRVMVRSRLAREKCLAPGGAGTPLAGEVVFERNLGGKAEDWELLPAATAPTDRAGFDETQAARRAAGLAGRGMGGLAVPTHLVGTADGEEKRARGAYLRAGDRVALRSCLTGELLVLRQAYEGAYEGKGSGAARVGVAAEGQTSTEAATWQVVVAGTPFLPPWTAQRAYLTGKFLLKPQRHAGIAAHSARVVEALFGPAASQHRAADAQQPSLLRTLPAAVQEQLVLDDLLSSFMGFEGKYVRASAGGGPGGGGSVEVVFALEAESMDHSLASLAERMLPLGGALVGVKAFVAAKSRHEHGMVAHALAAALKVLVKEYLVLVAQLEHQLRTERLTMQKLWFFVQPALHTMLVLQEVCRCADGHAGGDLLNVLHALSDRDGDEKSVDLHSFLLARAAAPYLEMLRRWIYEGVLDDPYHEFMVAEEEGITKETVAEDFTTAYWERRYTLRPNMVAAFLGRFEDKLLTTGKYLNVVRECGRDVRCPDADVFAAGCFGGGGGGGVGGLLLGEAAYGEVIERAFRFASSTVLELLLGEMQLVERLQSMKHYFLMDQGDLYVNFMDLAEDELRQEMRAVSKPRIEALLQLAVQTSCANLDPFKDDLTCDFAPYSMIQHLDAIHAKDGTHAYASASGAAATSSLKGIEVFMLDYRVSWPASLVVSKRSVTKYQLVFRHLFFARHVERCLKATWQGQQSLKELDVRAAGGRSYCLRHRMMGFMQNIVHYFTYEVIEPRWHEMEQQLRNCSTMDEVLAAHVELQDTVLKECLLTNQELLKVLTKIMTICLLFAEQMNRFFEANRLAAHAPSLEHGGYALSPDSGYRYGLPASERMEAGESGGADGHGSLGGGAAAAGSGRGDTTAMRRARVDAQSRQIRSELEQQSYVKMIQSYEKNFDQLLRDFMSRLARNARYQYNSHLANLVTRLDYNGFFSSHAVPP